MKKFKKILSIILILALVFSFAACSGGNDNAQTSDNETVTITDDDGNQVTVPKNPERIVVCDMLPLPSVLAIFFDSAEKIVGMSPTSMNAAENGLLAELYPEILNTETSFINGSEVNTEELMKLDPDVVFYTAHSTALGEKLRAEGFNAVAISVDKWHYDCIETLSNWISLISQMYPDNDKTEIVTDYSNKIYDLVQSRVANIPDEERARVFFLYKYSENEIMTSGENFFGQWWADAIGAKNVAYDIKQNNQVTVNMEQIYSWDPDIILITNFTSALPEDLYGNTMGNNDWSGIKAVKDKKVYKMPLGMYRSYTPGADTPVTLLWLAKTVYPDLFEDIDITKEAMDYYKSVFGVTLTEAQVNSIFAPTAAMGSGF